jgi:hypothetical protein
MLFLPPLAISATRLIDGLGLRFDTVAGFRALYLRRLSSDMEGWTRYCDL